MVDRYTRFILTVIAVCLVWIVIRDTPVVATVLAQAGLPTYKGGTVHVTIRGIDECTSCAWESLPVKVQ